MNQITHAKGHRPKLIGIIITAILAAVASYYIIQQKEKTEPTRIDTNKNAWIDAVNRLEASKTNKAVPNDW